MPKAVLTKYYTDHITESVRGGSQAINWTFMSREDHLRSVSWGNKQIRGGSWSWELVSFLALSITFFWIGMWRKEVNVTQNGSVSSTVHLTTGQRLIFFSAHKVCIYPVKFLSLIKFLPLHVKHWTLLCGKCTFSFQSHFLKCASRSICVLAKSSFGLFWPLYHVAILAFASFSKIIE